MSLEKKELSVHTYTPGGPGSYRGESLVKNNQTGNDGEKGKLLAACVVYSRVFFQGRFVFTERKTFVAGQH